MRRRPLPSRAAAARANAPGCPLAAGAVRLGCSRCTGAELRRPGSTSQVASSRLRQHTSDFLCRPYISAQRSGTSLLWCVGVGAWRDSVIDETRAVCLDLLALAVGPWRSRDRRGWPDTAASDDSATNSLPLFLFFSWLASAIVAHVAASLSLSLHVCLSRSLARPSHPCACGLP